MSGFIRFLGALIVTTCALGVSVGLHAAEPTTASAEAAVDGYISGLLSKMDTIKPLYETDRAAYFAAVESALTEFVDFTEVARGVMAKYGTGPNGATPEQLARFADVFRASLVDFYGSALAGYDAVSYQIEPATEQPEDPANATNVRMFITSGDGSRFEVQYTMFIDAQQQWMLKNLYIEGVNLRRQYYSQFDSLMATNNYDIDRVIENWAVTN